MSTINLYKAIKHFVVFLAFITINTFGAVNVSQADDTGIYLSATDSHLSFEALNQAADYTHTPFHSPAEPSPVPRKQEDKDDKDNVDEDEWTNSSLSLNTLLNNTTPHSPSKQKVSQFLEALANRRQLSLFILHCSWKSFLS